MALDDLTPIPYLYATLVAALILLRQIQQKLRWRVSKPLERRRWAFMFLVAMLFLVNLTLGLEIALNFWMDYPDLWDYMRQPAGLAILRIGEALALTVLFWFYYIDRLPPKNGDSGKE